MARAYLSLGSNAANRRSRLDQAERRIATLPGTAIVSRSGDAITGDVPPDQRDHLYRVIGIDTRIKARALLAEVISVEAAMGRNHTDAWGPRPIDIDLIAYDDVEIRSSRLNLPHAFAHKRPYILEALRQVDPAAAAFVLKVGMRPR